jgi:transcriptional regulator CtsR
MVSPANPDQKMQHCPHRKTIAEMAEAVQQWWLSAKAERVAERLVAVPSQVEYVLQ